MRSLKLRLRRWGKRNGKFMLLLVTLMIGFHLYLNRTEHKSNSLQTSPGPAKSEPRQQQENKLPPKEADKETKCGLEKRCDGGTFAYNIIGGSGKEAVPSVCFNDVQFKKDFKRGINIIVFDFVKAEEKDFKTFDLYTKEGDADFLLYMNKRSLEPHEVLLAVSMDEMTLGLSSGSRSLLNPFGSSKLSSLKYRDNYIFIGQQRASPKAVVEVVTSKQPNQDFPDTAKATGCIKLPMEEAKLEDLADIKNNPGEGVVVSAENCGMQTPCDQGKFAVHLYSGKGNEESPRICVNGKYYMDQGVNSAGRGFNVVVFNPKSKKVRQTANFDTYEKDSTALELFLESLMDGEIVLVVTNDDAATKLGSLAKKIWQDLGSGAVQNLEFRDMWGMVTIKGIKGFSPYEEIRFKMPDGSWPDKVDLRKCVEYDLKGIRTRPISLGQKNAMRRKFCKTNDGYMDFCDSEHIDTPLDKALLVDTHMEGNPIFNVPIVCIPGFNNVAFVKQLQSILAQPGIVVENVMVTFDEVFKDHGDLAQIFGFRSAEITVATQYPEKVMSSIKKAFDVFSSAQNLIVIEEDIIVSLDFLSYMAQLLPVLNKDHTIATISAFNPNGYELLSGSLKRVYRVDDSPGLAFMISRDFFQKHYTSADCCNKRAWFNWGGGHSSIIPEVSRIYHTAYQGSSLDEEFLVELLGRPRLQNMNTSVTLDALQLLDAQSYDDELTRLLGLCHVITVQSLGSCKDGPDLSAVNQKSIAIIINQEKDGNYENFNPVTKCFGLFSLKGFTPRGKHKDVIWFTYKSKEVFLVGSRSPFKGSLH